MRQWVVLWLALVVIGSPAFAGEIGTTPDGNVIYRFTCPHVSPKDIDPLKIDWPNHIGDHPEWDAVSGTSQWTPASVHVDFSGKVRQGQTLECRYKAKLNPGGERPVEYRYKVKREIISCQSAYREWTCILKPSSGGK